MDEAERVRPVKLDPERRASDWSGMRVLVIGAARQGLALARYLKRHGAKVVLNDQRPMEDFEAMRGSLEADDPSMKEITWVCGGHPLSLLDGTHLVCVSGGVPLTLPLIQEATRRGIALSNDSQIFMEVAPCKVIGITGSAGKTTTTTLIGQMAQQALHISPHTLAYERVWVGGNIGTPLLNYVDELTSHDLVIAEFSSFQLELMHRSPHLAVILNITPNHLDRHRTMAAYIAAKARILEYQGSQDFAILGRDDPGAWSLRSHVHGTLASFGLSSLDLGQSGTYLRDEEIRWRSTVVEGAHQPAEYALLPLKSIRLRGEHNLLNVMAASAIAAAIGLPPEAVRLAVEGFRGVPHRLEFVRRWGGADWYNDSIATAPERAIAAMRSFTEPLVLLAGGRDKDLPWEDFARCVHQRVNHVILFGEAAEKIRRALTSFGEPRFTLTVCSTLKEAVQSAASIVQPGDVVLFSPGGTSFDEFKDFEERGRCFIQWVNELP